MRFEASGKSYELRYDFNAICSIEDMAGLGFEDLIAQKKGVHTSVRYLLWGGLLHQNKDLTLIKTGEIIEQFYKEGKNITDVVKLIFDGLIKGGFLSSSSDSEKTEDLGEQILSKKKDST
jgi:hypothetical protein